jgi:streptogramin lyase
MWGIAFILLPWTCFAFLLGCGGTTTPSTTVGAGVTLQGKVLAGQQPVSGTKVYLYTAGLAGYGSASTSLLNSFASGVSMDEQGNGYVTTTRSGSFTISANWNCTRGTDEVYILALGGSPGPAHGPSNPALALMAVLGPCNSLTSAYPSLMVDEVTTVVSAWALQQFMTDATHIGASASGATGLSNAFAQVRNIVDITTGRALAKTAAGNGTLPQGKINTLANILASCTNAATDASMACGKLFSAATPAGRTPAAETIAVALFIARNPGDKVSTLFGLTTRSGPYQPQLVDVPNDWMLFVTFTGGGLNGPTSLDVDASGNLWVSNYVGVASAFSPVGTPLAAAGFAGGGLNESFGMAIDTSNHSWFANQQSSGEVNSGLGTITELNGGGQPLSGTSGYDTGGIYFPIAVAADPNGNMWIANYGDSKVTLLDGSGKSLSGAAGWGGTSLEFPVALAVDANHNAWVANQSANSITKISADGSTTTVITCCNGASGIATDQGNNVWVANYYGNSISEVSSGGVVRLNGVTGGGVLHPQGIAVDGSGTVWVANYRGNSISEVSGASSASAGIFLSPAGGFGVDASLSQPYGLALDGSGNVWVSNFGNDTITQFLGIATPIKTPFAGPPSLP